MVNRKYYTQVYQQLYFELHKSYSPKVETMNDSLLLTSFNSLLAHFNCLLLSVDEMNKILNN